MVLAMALVDRHLREAGLEHRARYVPARHETVDDTIDILEVEGGVPVAIQLAGGRYCVNLYEMADDGEVVAFEDCGSFATPGEAAARVVEVLRRATP
jgi:hypothetical protein